MKADGSRWSSRRPVNVTGRVVGRSLLLLRYSSNRRSIRTVGIPAVCQVEQHHKGTIEMEPTFVVLSIICLCSTNHRRRHRDVRRININETALSCCILQ
jgi:hypothetical protein